MVPENKREKSLQRISELGDPRPGVCTQEPDMIEIPAGDFLYGARKETRTIEQPFAIARYPVTVVQYGLFMEDGGYEEPRYWGGEESDGWQWRLADHPGYRGEGPVTQPRYWLQPRWHGENRPIVGVSWYETQAYCTWLSEKSGKDYRLPREEEWERAARHTDGRSWAWGSEWKDGIINSFEARIVRTTTVGAFPHGETECGAQDMSGNVWEWTASFYDERKFRYVTRGGAWLDFQGLALVTFRDRLSPYNSIRHLGFRVVAHDFRSAGQKCLGAE